MGRVEASPIEPHRFGRYTVLGELSEGGAGILDIAIKDGSSELCVLKRLRLELRGDATAGKRIQREAHLASFLNHENIARVLDAGAEGEIFYIASELIVGESLGAVLEESIDGELELPAAIAVRIALDVLSGIGHAHGALDEEGAPLNLVHRDLSPGNVMLGFDGSVKVIDFGAARGNVDSFMSVPGTVIGTPGYIAPEILESKPVDHRVDLYGLSVLLFEMLAGVRLVPAGSLADMLKWIVTKKPPKLSEVAPALPRPLDAVLAKGLARQADARWQTAGELRDALLDAIDELTPATREELGRFMRETFAEKHRAFRRLIEAVEMKRARITSTEISPPDLSQIEPSFSVTASDVHDRTTNVEVELQDRTPLSSIESIEGVRTPVDILQVLPPLPQTIETAIPQQAISPRPSTRAWIILVWLVASVILLGCAIAFWIR
jgi:eukaryotic-like serine/threonine-protein kinase